VLSYVEEHCRERVTLDEVAEVVHLSPSRVRHVFRDVSGVGFKEYATRVRLTEAKRLLLATDLSVAEVAHSVGYTNVHQFYTVFHRYCSLLPAEYRRYYTPARAGDGNAARDAVAAATSAREPGGRPTLGAQTAPARSSRWPRLEEAVTA
jgi:AraC-like DNA-binding protein